ncbi:MAG: DUF1887 family protein [Verrucomicrobiae bacterium]|nr:DUF1887 family protein [Verrucomicrobiae bacterium]
MTTLIHLVSEQTMQNLLPILALRPNVVVQLRSRADRFHQAAENLKNAVHAIRDTILYRDLQPEFREEVIEADSPTVEQTETKIRELLRRFPHPIVNITGGTKLMSLGAWKAVADQTPIIYCDTAECRFVPVGRHPLPQLPPFPQIAASLTVEAVMAAHGVTRDNWKFDQPTEPLRAVGRVGFSCRQANEQAFRDFGEAVRSHFRSDAERIPRGNKKLSELVARPLPAAPPSVSPFLEALANADLLAKRGDRFYPNVEPSREKVEQLANLLEGSWLELYVVDLLLNHTDRWTDPHWSVEPRHPEQVVFGETDVICVNVQATALQIISCKTVLRQQLETLEALAQRRRDLGGTFAKATLAVLSVSENERRKLTNWARLLNVQLLVGDEITKAFSP